jgi:hypothetical protein
VGMPTYKVRHAHIRASVSGAHAVAGSKVRATTHRRRAEEIDHVICT